MTNILFALVPVFLFLGALVVMDTFKLLRLRSVLLTIGVGCVVALTSFVINTWLLNSTSISAESFSRYIAPVIEETLKAAFVAYLITSRKVGFMVDSAIYGFAVGAGFAFVENIYYLQAISTHNPFIWLVRGLGTAVMHGGTTALFGIVAGKLSEQRTSLHLPSALLSLLIAIVVHSVYNHFFVPPFLSTLLLLIILPLTIMGVFRQSEQATQDWLGVGLDTDMDLLNIITKGNVPATKIGIYFRSLQDAFPGEVIADMLCFIRIHVELSIRAKGILLMRSTGFAPRLDSDVSEKFTELNYLAKSIGTTGKLALTPFLHTSRRELWQIYMLEDLQKKRSS